jgi:2,4-dienoyl-CoA reductase-like NADH-dependent reductase (Old Yellow Enzyme family)
MTVTIQERYDVAQVDTTVLGESIVLPFSGLVAKSRFMKGAMSERLASWDQYDLSKRGIPSEELIHLYEEWGKGGFGIVLSASIELSST